MNILLASLMLGLFVVASVSAIYFLYLFLTNFQPGTQKIKSEIKKMQAELEPYINQLVPWNQEEMELLSLNQVNTSAKKRVVRTIKGVFTTIYHEPALAYIYRSFPGFGKEENAVLLARTAAHEFIYRIKGSQTELTINNLVVGTIKNQSLLYGASSNRLIARINRDDDQLLLPIYVQDKELGSLNAPDKVQKVNPRAFEFLRKMDEDETALYLSLASLEMIRKTNQL